jgi:hypothetical protein
MKSLNHTCAVPDCNLPGVFKVEDENWLCSQHLGRRLNFPENAALTEADADLQDFLSDGGKPS